MQIQLPDRKTVFVIGAGASSEAKLSTGSQLKAKIADLLNIEYKGGFSQSKGDRCITGALRIYAQQTDDPDMNPYIYAARHIRDAMPLATSIDNFIDTHNNDRNIELCGKLGIVRSILEDEKNSLLYIDDSNSHNKLNLSALETTWYVSFMRLLTENCVKEKLAKRLESIVLIVFNYDRCIEHFLYNSLQYYYGINSEEAAKLIDKIEIYHPYGVVGSLPWQDSRGRQTITYGESPHPGELLSLATQIKTFTEGTDPNSSQILSIRNGINEADKIVFLGFAFHKLNMKLISPDTHNASRRCIPCFGTAHGISDGDCNIIKAELSKLYTGDSISDVNISNKLDCWHLFKEYRRSLSLNSL
jgi:hypothetical protein